MPIGLKIGIDINKGARDGMTLLQSAALGSKVPLLKFLLELGADPNITDDYGTTLPEIMQCKTFGKLQQKF